MAAVTLGCASTLDSPPCFPLAWVLLLGTADSLPCVMHMMQLHSAKTAGSLLALLWVLLGILGVFVSLDTNSAPMPHMCELGFETEGDKV
jgi:hypothetical protein